MNEIPDICPRCGIDLHDLEHPGFLRVISIVDRERGRVVAWKCPDCGERWERK